MAYLAKIQNATKTYAFDVFKNLVISRKIYVF